MIKCDVCGRVKGETNHWLIAVTSRPEAEHSCERGVAFAALGAHVDTDFEQEHICGADCAHKKLSEFLETL